MALRGSGNRRGRRRLACRRGGQRQRCFVAITSHADDETRRKALAAGFDDFLPKLVSALLVPAVARLRAPR